MARIAPPTYPIASAPVWLIVMLLVCAGTEMGSSDAGGGGGGAASTRGVLLLSAGGGGAERRQATASIQEVYVDQMRCFEERGVAEGGLQALQAGARSVR